MRKLFSNKWIYYIERSRVTNSVTKMTIFAHGGISIKLFVVNLHIINESSPYATPGLSISWKRFLKMKSFIFAGCWITISKFLRNVPYSKDYSQRLCQPKNHRCLQRHPNLEGWNGVLRICQKSLWRDQKWANGGGERRCQQTYLSLRKNKAVNSVNLWFLPKTDLQSY